MEKVVNNVARFTRPQNIGRIIALYELYKLAAPTKGAFIECGVHDAGSLFTWGHLTTLFEPHQIHRRIYGFDTFNGFPSVATKDHSDQAENPEVRQGGFLGDSLDNIEATLEIYDRFRPRNDHPKIELVAGDARETIPQFVEGTPHLVVALLFLDFDLYEPTKLALENFLPLMPKGAVLAFDEVNHPLWPGETVAAREMLDFRSLELKHFPFEPNISYAVL